MSDECDSRRSDTPDIFKRMISLAFTHCTIKHMSDPAVNRASSNSVSVQMSVRLLVRSWPFSRKTSSLSVQASVAVIRAEAYAEANAGIWRRGLRCLVVRM